MIIFSKFTIEELNAFVKKNETTMSNLHIALKDLYTAEELARNALKNISFSLEPNFEEIYKSIRSYLGIFTEENLNAKDELNKRSEVRILNESQTT